MKMDARYELTTDTPQKQPRGCVLRSPEGLNLQEAAATHPLRIFLRCSIFSCHELIIAQACAIPTSSCSGRSELARCCREDKDQKGWFVGITFIISLYCFTCYNDCWPLNLFSFVALLSTHDDCLTMPTHALSMA